jgi:hypothetical protein
MYYRRRGERPLANAFPLIDVPPTVLARADQVID